MEASDFTNVTRSGLYRRNSAGTLNLEDEVQEIVLHPPPLPYQDKRGLFRRQPTLTLITLEEDRNRINYRPMMEDTLGQNSSFYPKKNHFSQNSHF